jgi:hypothetical protein
MPIENIFQSLRKRILHSPAFRPMEKRAAFWFRTFYTDVMAWQRQLGTVTYPELMSQPIAKRIITPTKMLPGFLYFFLYEPATKDTLPFYDKFPLVLVIDKQPDSFTGLNFHYLDYYNRSILFDRLYELRQKNRDPLQVRMKFSYDYLAETTKYKQFRPCYRRYAFRNLKSPLFQVGESEWDVALWLPVELFAKAGRQIVWKDSERKIR